jgi:methylmalonyl-CoA mutase N-terminal domain/subunit
MGGTQSLHTNALDEALALPTEDTARIALRTQQILANESGVTDTVDPLGGSYYLEKLTDDIEQQAYMYFKKLDELGGMVRAIELGYPQRELGEAAYRYQRKLENREEIVVGVNSYTNDKETPIDILTIEPHVEKEHIARVRALRQSRDPLKLAQTLSALRQAACGDENLMPYLLSAVRAYGTFGEISDVLREVWGTYEEPTAAFSSP